MLLLEIYLPLNQNAGDVPQYACPLPSHDWHASSPVFVEELGTTGKEGTEDTGVYELFLQNVSTQGL